MIALWLLTGVLGRQSEPAEPEQSNTFVGGGFLRETRASLKPVAFRFKPLALKATSFATKKSKWIKLERAAAAPIPVPVPEPVILVARVAAQPVPNFMAICHPVFDKSAVIARRNAQIEKMLNSAQSYMVEQFWQELERG